MSGGNRVAVVEQQWLIILRLGDTEQESHTTLRSYDLEKGEGAQHLNHSIDARWLFISGCQQATSAVQIVIWQDPWDYGQGQVVKTCPGCHLMISSYIELNRTIRQRQ
jgi:hypothetical protein